MTVLGPQKDSLRKQRSCCVHFSCACHLMDMPEHAKNPPTPPSQDYTTIPCEKKNIVKMIANGAWARVLTHSDSGQLKGPVWAQTSHHSLRENRETSTWMTQLYNYKATLAYIHTQPALQVTFPATGSRKITIRASANEVTFVSQLRMCFDEVFWGANLHALISWARHYIVDVLIQHRASPPDGNSFLA